MKHSIASGTKSYNWIKFGVGLFGGFAQ